MTVAAPRPDRIPTHPVLTTDRRHNASGRIRSLGRRDWANAF